MKNIMSDDIISEEERMARFLAIKARLATNGEYHENNIGNVTMEEKISAKKLCCREEVYAKWAHGYKENEENM